MRAGFCKKGEYSKYHFYGIITKYLCHLFIELKDNKNGVITRSDLEKFGILEKDKGNVNDFTNHLVKAKILSWDGPQNKINKMHFYQVFAFGKFAGLIEKEKGEEKATKRDLLIARQENTFLNYKIDEIQKTLNEHAECIKMIIKEHNPPYTEDKLQHYLKQVSPKKSKLDLTSFQNVYVKDTPEDFELLDKIEEETLKLKPGEALKGKIVKRLDGSEVYLTEAELYQPDFEY